MWYRVARLAVFLLVPVTVRQQPTKSSAQTEKGDPAATAAEPPQWATLVGSTDRNKYHRLQCGVAKKIKPANAIWFTDANDATENGYVPAGCNDRKCHPPLPDSAVRLGDLGGPGLPPPSLSPPEVPPVAAANAGGTKGKPQADRAKPGSGNAIKTRVPPPRMAAARDVALNQLWQGVPPERELEARWHWDVWANWALDRWCERWHVAPGGRINTDTAYADEMEQLLLAKLKQMKEQIEANKKRIKELRSLMEGKKKGRDR